MTKKSETSQEKVVVDTGIFSRELLEKACLEIKAKKIKLDEASKVS